MAIGDLSANRMGEQTNIESPEAEKILPEMAGKFYNKIQVSKFLEKENSLQSDQQAIAI